MDSVKYRYLKRQHPAYKVGHWQRLWAFYRGGSALLEDAGLLGEVFPAHAAERPDIYAERKRRAVYINHAGFLCNQLTAHLFSDPVKVSRDPTNREAEFYDRFLADCSPPGGERTPWPELLGQQVTAALVGQTAYTLVDMPRLAEAYGSRAEQEAAGALAAYVVPVPAEAVVNWHADSDGRLAWALIHREEQDRSALDYDAAITRHVYDYYTPDLWRRFVVEHGPERPQPGDDDTIPAVDGGDHAFGQVPLVRLRLPAKLWAMDQLESVVRGAFNKLNALLWAQDKVLFQPIYEFRHPELPGLDQPIGASTPPAQITGTPRGPGYAQLRYVGEDARYPVHDTSAFEHARQSLKDLREEMSRVLHSLNLSADVSAGALRRTAESKRFDQAPMDAFLGRLGRAARAHTVEVLDLVARARGDAVTFSASGLEEFDPLAVGELVEQALLVEQLEIPSPTFWRLYRSRVARSVLGVDAEDQKARDIDRELEEATTGDQTGRVSPFGAL